MASVGSRFRLCISVGLKRDRLAVAGPLFQGFPKKIIHFKLCKIKDSKGLNTQCEGWQMSW